MGWNSWNHFATAVSETLIDATADAIVQTGMADAGYRFVVIDDGWAVGRDDAGVVIADPTNFPNGMAAVAAHVHQDGLKFGIYTCAGTQTCAGRPGSYGYEQIDATTYAAWGVDYVKEDWCNTTGEDPQTEYTAMHHALVATARPIVFSLCDWGVSNPWQWGPGISNLWRTTGDIKDNWASFLSNLDSSSQHASAAGPGHWNDPDMLEVGNGGMTDVEYQSHFSLWAIMAAPLIAGNDVTQMSAATAAILMNREVIAVDQDPAGIQGSLVSDDGQGHQVWSKPLAQAGSVAVALLNRGAANALMSVPWTAVGLSGAASVRDLWAHQDLGSMTGYSASVASHATALLKVVGTPPMTLPSPVFYPAANTSNTLTGGAMVAACPNCAGGQKVGYVGMGATLVFNGVTVGQAGSYALDVDYLSGEQRTAQMTVNGGAPVTLSFASTGDFFTVGTLSTVVALDAGVNTIAFGNATGWAPDFDELELP